MGVDLFDALGGVARVAGVVFPLMTSSAPTQLLAVSAATFEPSSVTLHGALPESTEAVGSPQGFCSQPISA